MHGSDFLVPDRAIVLQNYPNPFNPATSIQYVLPKSSKVLLKIYNMVGQEIRTLIDEFQTAGMKSVTWDGIDDTGNAVRSGLYIYRFEACDMMQNRKMLLLQ